MKISIIIPVYKVEKYLRRCLDSVLNQTHKDFEIILIDDGSPDKSGEICDEYAQKDNRIFVLHKENNGVSEARNSGIKAITGDYIFFLDSDDFIEKEALSILFQRAEITGADIIIGNYKVINENNEIFMRDRFDKESLDEEDLKNSTIRFKYFFGKSYGVQVWNTLYKSSFIKIHNLFFEKDIYYGEDFLFNLILFINHPKIELVNKYTYYYFENVRSITNSDKKELTEQYLNLLEVYYEYLKRHNKLLENQDLIAYRAITSVDTSGLNSYQYSDNKFVDLKNELKKFKSSQITNKVLKDLAKGKYLKEVPRKDWKYYVWVFSVLYSLNFLNIATLLQLLRFKVSEMKSKNYNNPAQMKGRAIYNIDKHLKIVHIKQHAMLKEVKRICEKNSINYFLVAGSALGAVRHNDIIPWDDDIDVGMLRNDYEKFLVVCKDELLDSYFLQNYSTDLNAPYQFSKIRENNTLFVEEEIKKLTMHKGIYIDIFPIDNFPNEKYKQIIQYLLLVFFSVFRQSITMEMALASRSKIRKTIRLVIFFLRKLIPKRITDKFETKVMTYFNNEDTESFCCFDLYGINNYRRKTVMKKNVILPVVLIKFGNDIFPIPGNYDYYLRQIFDNYMEYPPLGERNPHHNICKIEYN